MDKNAVKSANILIIGGSGYVGRIIHNVLQKRNPNLNVYIGSRGVESNEDNKINIDVTNPKTFKVMDERNIDILLLCSTDKEDNILKHCISKSIDYIDITKPTHELQTAYKYAERKNVSSRIVFSSGWMSGIIGSLLYWAEPAFKSILEVQIFIYYSLNDRSGKTSADFMADVVSKPFKIFMNNNSFLVKYYTKPRGHMYSFNIGRCKTYLFDTPDALILNTSENIPTIETRTTYSSKFVTWLLYMFQITGAFHILSSNIKKKMFASNGTGDRTIFEIVIKTKNTSQKISIQNSTGQADLTAFATVLHIEQLLKNERGKECTLAIKYMNPQHL
jgi:saccharopine dehydrogenase-like NADP-dependent oxidoreductase